MNDDMLERKWKVLVLDILIFIAVLLALLIVAVFIGSMMTIVYLMDGLSFDMVLISSLGAVVMMLGSILCLIKATNNFMKTIDKEFEVVWDEKDA